MKTPFDLAPELHCLSLLFSYPEYSWAALDLPVEASGTAHQLLAALRSTDTTVVQTEYVRLFVNAVPTLPCPPYGSCYLEGSLQGRSSLCIAATYESYGMTCQEPADHIGVETAFLGLLLAARPDDEHVVGTCRFLSDHLSRWAPRFFALVRQHDRLGIYGHCATFGEHVLRELHQTIASNWRDEPRTGHA